MVKAMYAFSADPITYGHMDVVERASKTFDKVVVGIGSNPDKKYAFSLEERMDMAKKSLKIFPNVEVDSFRGLLVDYAYENGIGVVIKGARNSTDFDYENVLHQVGESQNLGIDTHVLFARPELAYVSSSVAKALVKEQGDVRDYVPSHVKQRLEARISNQYIVGITGEMGSGKSYVSERFVKLGKERGIEVHNVDLDKVGHKVLSDLTNFGYENARRQIVDTFGSITRKEDGTIDRKVLGEIVFNDDDAMKSLNEIMATPMATGLRKEMYGKKGIILFNAALIAEQDMSYVCNNNTVLVYADKNTQKSRLASRGLTPAQMETRLATQFDFEGKKNTLEQAVKENNSGKVWTLDNSDGQDEIEKVFEKVILEVGVYDEKY